MHGCKKCSMVCAGIFLVLGILFLLGDLNIWGFWGINWWSVLFLTFGVTGFAMSKCPDCQKKRK